MHLGTIERVFGRSVEVIQKEIADRFAELEVLTEAGALAGAEVGQAAVLAQRLRSMAEAHCARTAALLDASKEWVAEGARSAKDWLAWTATAPKGRVGTDLRNGRRLREMPATEAAFLAGDLTADHVRLLITARTIAPEAFDESGEAYLIGLVGELLYSQWAKAVRYWCDLAAPDDAEAKARARYEQRRAHCSRTFEGCTVLDATFDPIGGGIFARELDRLSRELLDEDLAEARERLGVDSPALHDLRRTPEQRRADALVRMAERSAAKPPGSVEPRILLSVLAGIRSVERMCELSDGTIVTPGEVLPLLTRADVERVVFASPSRVLDVGLRQRFFTGATRRAVQVRDRICAHPSCDAPVERCDVDHVQPFATGGPTTQANGQLLCRYHNLHKSRDG